MKFEIMMGILFDLLSKRCVTATYLADKYEVSVRSIYRYMQDLELANVPIYTVRGKSGGFAVIDTFKLSSTFMTVKEYEQVIDALTAINEGVKNKTLESAINKLKANIKHEFSGFNIRSGNLIIDAGPWGDAIGYKTKLKILQTAIDENLQLFIKYHDRNGEISERVIDPHVIVFKQGLWYVYAYCNLRNEFRFFKTGRIEQANVLNTKFERKNLSEASLPLDFWNQIQEVTDISLEIKNNCLSDVEEWLGIENVHKEHDKFVARVKLPIDDGLVSKIMSFGNGIKVLEPECLIEKIKDNAEKILKQY